MSNELQIAPSSNLPTATTEFSQTGDNNTQIAHAQNVNNTINIIIPSTFNTQMMGTCVHNQLPLNRNYYNLFVIGGESFNTGHFTVPKNRALTESIAPALKERYASLTSEAIEQLKTFPALFASENHDWGDTDAEHWAYFGLVLDIKVQENGIKIYFQLLSRIQQQRLNELAEQLAIKKAPYINELYHTHWTVKKLNLIEELHDAGISVLVPA